MLPHWQPVLERIRNHQGWLFSPIGKAPDAVRMIASGLAEWRSTGSTVWLPLCSANLATAVGRKYRSGGLGIDKSPVRRSCWNDGGGGAGVAIVDLSHCVDFQAKVAANRGKPLSAPAVSGAAASASAAVPEKRRSALLDSGAPVAEVNLSPTSKVLKA